MSEPVKCPRCEEGELYERAITYYYSPIIRNENGEIDCGDSEGGDDYETDCWMCLDCGAIIDWDEQNAIYEGKEE